MQQTYKALADPTRRKILQLLRDRDLSAGKIALHFDSAQPTISRHLSILQNADLIQGSKNGTTITYRLNLSVLEEAFMTMLDTFKLDVGGNDEPANPSDD